VSLVGNNTEGERRRLLYCGTHHAWWHDSQTRSVCRNAFPLKFVAQESAVVTAA